MYYIGIDLGTSGVKLLMMDETGRVLKTVTEAYPLSFPKSGWAEQDPEDWYEKTMTGLRKLTEDCDRSKIAAISYSGQMHGLVALDADDRVIRPAILWNDGRTVKETEYLNEKIGKEQLAAWTGNIAFAGFTAPKILWVRDNEPENFSRIRKIMLPKDYLSYRMTGSFCTDYSDAAGTLLMDVEKKQWSQEMLKLCGLETEMLPRLCESFEVVGTLKKDLAEALEFPETVRIAAGAADNAAAAVGTGTVGTGGCNLSLGTSGTILIPSAVYHEVPGNALHNFAHADGGWYLMGCMLSAASCWKWWMEQVIEATDNQQEQAGIRELGHNPVYFLPYLMGERCPHNDPAARGAFIGMSADTGRREMAQAVLEGVIYGLRDSLEVARGLGVKPDHTRICGGGAKSGLWKKIAASILNLPVEVPENEEGPAFGAAILAAVGDGAYESVPEAAEKLCRVRETVLPDPALTEAYEKGYQRFRTLYPALKPLFAQMAEENRK